MNDDQGAPSDATEANDIRTVVDYLGLAPTGRAAQRITGMTGPAISTVLRGNRQVDAVTRQHLATVAAVVTRLAAARAASTGTPRRGASAAVWLELTKVGTSRGIRTPIDILADREMCEEVLRDLMR